ncbi:hypothetical protein [Salibaculum halophilum]|uniref:hypothetical protein n=1 Tax=Salibaculum halophilum TaxID=1914408 RepID=UPI0015C47437|nr:hypothetical protein [Salibaculum halophilum]
MQNAPGREDAIPDICTEIRTADRDTQGVLADAMITRAAYGALTAMRRQSFDWRKHVAQ